MSETTTKPKINRTRRIVVTVTSMVLGVGIFGLGYAFGNHNLEFSKSFVPVIANRTIGAPKNVDFSEFWTAYNKVQSSYAGDTVDNQKLVYGAIKGMVSALGDPYSYYLTPDEQKQFFSTLNGTFDGIGAEVGQQNSEFVIIAPLDGTPAQRAGLKPGDQIVTVDGKDVSDKTLDEVVSEIQGPKGTTVKLGIIPSGAKEVKEVDIVRDKINVPSVANSIRPDGIGVIRITQFGQDSAAAVKTAAQSFKDKNVKGIVLDLRSNPGGYLDGAVDVGSLWIKSGPIVSEKSKDGTVKPYDANGDAILNGIPTAVLVDNGSASAAEIVAGALQDTGQGRLFGEKTFGKGSVQDVTALKDQSALRLTVAKWLTPNGKNINHEGITPDETIENVANSGTTQSDKVMDRAIEWLGQQIKK